MSAREARRDAVRTRRARHALGGRTRPILALGTALGIALAAACGAGCRSGKEPVHLRFWAMGREGEVVTELVHDFERTHPGIEVEVQQIPWSAAHEKLLTSYVGRATPDVAQLGNTWVSEFVALHALEPLDARIATATEARPEHFFKGIWDTNVIANVVYGVPWYVDTRVLFYRRDLLARAGYREMPTTWAEWRRAMEAIRRTEGPGHFAILLPTNEWPQPMILGLQAGATMLKDDDTRAAFESPEFRRAFDFYLGLFRDGLAPPVSNNQIANLYQEFGRGRFAMLITGPWNLGEFARRLPPGMDAAWTTAPLPGPDGPGLSMAGGSSLVVFSGTRHADAAWQLVEFLSRTEQQVRFYHLSGDLPARTEAWRDSALVADPKMRAFGAQLERTAPWPKVPEWEEISIRLQDQVERAVRGTATADSALATLDRDVDRMLEKRRWLHARGLDALRPAAGTTGVRVAPPARVAAAGVRASGGPGRSAAGGGR
ncbi:MAG TPA: sugar ABC transporter substrate-binding protein [Candidatus Saccharimonadaceae bacterium]|nr:sugar ABC transporter substrate-binding protein [Candidatus Saccharimonadaceae bacterium]